MVNPSKRDSAAGKVVAVARSILTCQIGLPAGCVRMLRTLIRLAPHETGPMIVEKFERDSTSTDSPLTSKVALYILHAAFPLTTLTEPVLNRGMYGCARVEQCDERKQGRRRQRARIEP